MCEDRTIIKKFYLFTLMVAVASGVAAAALLVSSKSYEYNSFVDKALYENGVTINSIAASRYGRDDSAPEFKVAIDEGIPEIYSHHIQSVYEFLARVSGRTVVFDIAQQDVFSKHDRYVYIGHEDYFYNHNIVLNPFVGKLKNSIKREFPNSNDKIFLENLNARLGIFLEHLCFSTMSFRR